jgi:hypothetical protein
MSTTTVSINQYCDNPADYKNVAGLTNDTRAYWDTYCAARIASRKAGMPSTGALSNFNADLLVNLINGLMAPESLEIIGSMLGGIIALKLVKAAIGNFVKNGLSDVALKAAQDYIIKGGSKFAANSTGVFSGIFGDSAFVDKGVLDAAKSAAEDALAKSAAEGAAEAAAVEGAEFAGRYAVAACVDAAEFIGDIASGIGIVMMVVQVVGMVLDVWDPCDLNEQLTASVIEVYNTSFNTAFRRNLLVSMESSRDSYGRITYSAIWPVRYYAEKSALIPIKKDYYDAIHFSYMATYLDSLTYNSDGDPIFHPPPGHGTLLSNEVIKGLELSTFGIIGNNNTVVENWLIRWWPLFVGAFILVIVILIFIKGKKSL